MTTRPAAALTLTLAAALALSACTDDEGPAPTSGTDGDSASATDEALPPHPADDWWCQFVDKDLVDAASGDRSAEATQVVVANDGEHYRCEVQLPGTADEPEVVLALDVRADDAAAVEAARTEVQARDGVTPGPDYLGESYVAPGQVVAITTCGLVPGNPPGSDKVPWLLTFTAPTEAGATMVEGMTSPLNYYHKTLDQTVGCSPKQAREDAGLPTTD